MTEECPDICTCGYPEGTFACKIRHVQLNTGDAKAARDGSTSRSRLRDIDTGGQ